MLCHIQLNLYGSRICLTLVFLFCVLLKNKLNAKISKGDTMLYDFIIIDKTSCAPLYMQIYASIRRSVENGSLVKNTKLPSVRQLSSGLEVSKTTVSAAYEQLCVEGYIKNKPQSGYYVEAQFENAPKKSENTHSSAIAQIKRYDYDFSGKSIDDKIINIDEWKKYVKEVINTGYMLMSYGEPQGETVLRNALQKYSLGVRSVNTSAENIVVGAGTQLLLYLLCSLVGTNKTVAMAKSSYIQAEFIFKTLGLDIKYFDTDSKGITISSLEKIKPDMVLINPNFIAENGMSMPVSRRLELIKWAKENDCIIIEDDYNGELRYSTHPMPCVQNYDIENTVYLGSFSKNKASRRDRTVLHTWRPPRRHCGSCGKHCQTQWYPPAVHSAAACPAPAVPGRPFRYRPHGRYAPLGRRRQCCAPGARYSGAAWKYGNSHRFA